MIEIDISKDELEEEAVDTAMELGAAAAEDAIAEEIEESESSV